MPSTMNPDSATTLGLNALSFVVASGEAAGRFLDQSGLDPATLRVRASESDLLVSVLDFILSDERLLILFCGEEAIDVRTVHIARHVLAGA